MELKLDRNKTYGLALEGGGAKGAYQIGAWKALREAGIRFSAVSSSCFVPKLSLIFSPSLDILLLRADTASLPDFIIGASVSAVFVLFSLLNF